MAQYSGDVWMGSDVGRQTVTVSSNTSYGAKRMMAEIYNADENDIYNVRQVSNSSDSSGGGSMEGSGILLGGAAILFLIVFLAPWVFMAAGGALGYWVSKKLCGTGLSDAVEDENGKAIAIILASTLALGGFGFVQGNNFKESINTETTQTQQLQQQ